jgi:hypothetical protein
VIKGFYHFDEKYHKVVIDWCTEIIDIATVDITEKSTVFQYCSFHISELVIIDWKELFFAIVDIV